MDIFIYCYLCQIMSNFNKKIKAFYHKSPCRSRMNSLCLARLALSLSRGPSLKRNGGVAEPVARPSFSHKLKGGKMRYEFNVPLEFPSEIDDKQLVDFEEWCIEAISLKAKEMINTQMGTDIPDPVQTGERLGLHREEQFQS
jgi:hypothetical protein